MGPEVAAAAAIGGLALQAGGQIYKGYGEKDSQNFLAERDKRAAEIGRIKANQTDIALRDELRTTLGNIDAVRAASGIDPLSPTTAVLKGEEMRVSDRDRMTRVANIRAQADEDDLTADYRRKVGRDALIGGFLGAGASTLKGLSTVKYG